MSSTQPVQRDESPKKCKRCGKPADPWKSLCWKCAFLVGSN